MWQCADSALQEIWLDICRSQIDASPNSMANFLILVDFISYNESIFRADFVVVCMVKLQCFYAPAMKWGGAYSFTLVHTYVHTYVRPSHFFSTVLVSTTPPKVFDAGT